ncbi:hypothetical protein JCM19297_2705 [Nonlabens ulvanivorans]|nr:hypothetical protein JCM19297_2705 [Nonlabens ulvanivorans]
MAKTGNALVALVAGAAIGVAAGLLYAPESGEKTRKKLKKKADRAQKDIKNQAQTAYDTLTTKASEYKGTLDERIELRYQQQALKQMTLSFL